MPTAALWDSLWIDLSLATLEDGAADGYGAVSDAAVGVKDGTIVFAGPRGALPGPMESLAAHVHSGGGGWMTPGLIDAHTHLVHGGNRAREFEMRLQGASYEEIARAAASSPPSRRPARRTRSPCSPPRCRAWTACWPKG